MTLVLNADVQARRRHAKTPLVWVRGDVVGALLRQARRQHSGHGEGAYLDAITAAPQWIRRDLAYGSQVHR